MAKKPPRDTLMGFVRTDPQGHRCSCRSEDTAQKWFGMTPAQILCAKAGDVVTLENGSKVKWIL